MINFDGDTWDLKLIIPNYNKTDRQYLNFGNIKQHWLKLLVKKFIDWQLKIECSAGYAYKILSTFNTFSYYLNINNINQNDWLTRKVILDFVFVRSTKVSGDTVGNDLSRLNTFFKTAQLNQWLDIPEGLIRLEDYPKSSAPQNNDIPQAVFNRINENLHKMPDIKARMWMICYFCGMRISELQLCPLDCIQQNNKGQWSITFWQKKTKSHHTLPISRELAQVIQQQQQETKKVKGDNFEYLFSGVNVDILHREALQNSVNTLIKKEDIRDDNGKLWHFTNHQLRDTRATYLFETGHEMAVVSKWLGHKNWTTTQKYVHVGDNTLREETAKVQAQLTNIRGESVAWEGLPKTLQENPAAHTLAIPEDHINTPIYGFCGLALDRDCPHWKACYTCRSFVARKELLPDYIKIRDRLRDKQFFAEERGQTALIDQFKQQADSLDVIVHSFGGN